MGKDIAIAVLGIALAALVFVFWDQFTVWRANVYGERGKPATCTLDAKLCSDGTYVGRTGSNCEFVCPGE